MPFYRDDPGALLPWLLRLLSRSFRIGRFFRIEVRMYWVAAILMPLLSLDWFRRTAGTGLELLVLAACAVLFLYVIVWTHEMGHALWGRRYGIHTPLITLSPLGGVAHMGSAATDARSDALIALAGPAVHLLWLAVCWPLSLLLPAGTVTIHGWRYDPVAFGLDLLVQTNLTLMVFNLLPFFPMDGGRVLRALLAMRLHPNRATMIATAIGIGGGAVLMVYGISRSGIYGSLLVVIGVTNILACLDERRIARHTLIYGEPGDRRQSWQSDPEAWRHGADPFAHVREQPQRRPGLLTRLRQRLQARRARREPDLDRQVDRILDRVHKVGMIGLTDKERKILQRASRRRGTG